ncbi:hypothetical protein So717_42660 [Roseobacter cerasinus]|uniref:Uncharacterized protein n=1 Tax=Roseobacter cerasinus TaxID=2602289 RepID=A0A640VWJ3_9RHOB|nr:hypothetical protein So717_42660 [Roseobacter cerasinus]
MKFCDRPFSSVEEMDAVLIANMCDRVQEDDDLRIIGDFAFGPKSKDAGYLTCAYPFVFQRVSEPVGVIASVH